MLEWLCESIFLYFLFYMPFTSENFRNCNSMCILGIMITVLFWGHRRKRIIFSSLNDIFTWEGLGQTKNTNGVLIMYSTAGGLVDFVYCWFKQQIFILTYFFRNILRLGKLWEIPLSPLIWNYKYYHQIEKEWLLKIISN